MIRSVLLLAVIILQSVFSELYAQIVVHNYPPYTIIGPGYKQIDLDEDGTMDINFEVITLTFGSSDSLCARFQTLSNMEFYDQSTHGYPDAFKNGEMIQGPLNNGNAALGTVMGGGEFHGRGIRYLGIRLNSASKQREGWIEIHCSLLRDTLMILSSGYQSQSGTPILAGQKYLTGLSPIVNDENELEVYPNPSSGLFTVNFPEHPKFSYRIVQYNGQLMISGESTGLIDAGNLPDGLYLLELSDGCCKMRRIISIHCSELRPVNNY